VLANIEQENIAVDDIFIEPPDAAVNSDQDSADEDEGGLIDNHAGDQLRAGAEVICADSRRLGNDVSDSDSDDVEIEVTIEKKGKRSRKTVASDVSESKAKRMKKTPGKKFTWCKEDLKNWSAIFPAGDFTALRGMLSTSAFEMFINDDLLAMVCEESSKYALLLNCPNPKIGVEELQMFVHFADNTAPDLTEKLWKPRPIMDKLKSKFMSEFWPGQQLDCDESMVAYYGKHSCKQFF